MRGARTRRVTAVVAAVMLVATLAMSGTATGAPTNTKQPNQPVSSGERIVDGTLEGTFTRSCDGFITSLEGKVRSSFIGVGDLSLYQTTLDYGLWELNTNKGYIGGSYFTVTSPDFVPDPSVPWGFKVVAEKWLILEPIGGGGQFLQMGGFGGRLSTLPDVPVWTYVQGEPCDPNEPLGFSTRLDGELTFGGWGTMHTNYLESGTANPHGRHQLHRRARGGRNPRGRLPVGRSMPRLRADH